VKLVHRLAAALCVAASLSACDARARGEETTLAKAASSDWVGPQLAPFELISSVGTRTTLDSLSGRPFALEFVFTTCSGPCTRMSAGMELLQSCLADVDAHLVSVSVDPRTDTPEVLRAYGERFHADPARWSFLTGEESSVDSLARSVQLARAPDDLAPIGMHVAHATRIVVVDARSRVRGYYDGESADGLKEAEARLRWLAESAEH